ncbi:MAG: hypothetical protein ACRD4C_09210 [Candidatus Acidiferrales bacterium]
MRKQRATAWKWAISIAILLFVAAIVAIHALAPTLRRVARDRAEVYLRTHFQGSVQFNDFHVAFYPRIHVVITGLVIRHEGRTDIAPLVEVRSLTVNARFWDLLRRHPEIASIDLDGLQIHTPPRKRGGPPLIHGTQQNLAQKYPVVVEKITAKEALIVILRRDTKPPREFEIHQLELHNFDFTDPASFHALLTNPIPRGEIHCDGQFGPWLAGDPSETPVTGRYIFWNADMGTLKGLKGTLSSKGQFSGPLDYLNVQGETDIPNFALRTSDHPMALHTDFSAIVDGTNGDTYLNSVTAKFLNSTLVTKGKVVDEYPKMKGRTIVMDTVSQGARIEDLLLLAVKANPPVMTGAAKLKANILIPEGNADLLERLKIDAQFSIDNAHFTSDSVQGKINSLSRRGLGKPQETDLTAVSQLKGTFAMDQASIDFSSLSFAVPGASVALTGNYGLDTGQLDFRGTLRLQAQLSQTTTGVKSFFLKVLDPLFKGKDAGTVVPIKITGTKDHPSFGLDFDGKPNNE